MSATFIFRDSRRRQWHVSGPESLAWLLRWLRAAGRLPARNGAPRPVGNAA